MTVVANLRAAQQTNRAAEPVESVPAPRLDIYSGIHKGLRAWMSDALVQAGRADPTDADEVTALVDSVRTLLRFLRKHLEHENKFVHSAMERAIPGSSQAIGEDHVHHERAIALIDNELRGLEQAPSIGRPGATQRLYRRLALFFAENFAHMNVEETEHNAVLWATHSDPKIGEIEQAIVSSMPPEEMAIVLRWMVPAMSAPERAALFTGIRMNAPAAVVEGLLSMVRPHLSPRDWAKLCAAIGPLN
jgi:hypothetical protein